MRRHELRVIPHWHESVVSATAIRKTVAEPSGSVVDVYGPGYWPGDSECEQLEFALKYDGMSLALLAAIFPAVDPAAVARFVAAAPHGISRRRLWLFYEWLTGRRLPLPDLASYDRARESMRRVLDLPDRACDLFIRLVNQNGGRLSAAKPHASFASLTDDEIARLEAAVREAFATPPPG